MLKSLATKACLLEEILLAFKEIRFRANGSSMLPAVWPGDILVIQRASIEDVSVGDIVFFACYGSFVAHRVKKIEIKTGLEKGASCFRRLITQGDTVPEPDPPVTSANLLGQVSYVIRNGKPFRPSRSPGHVSRLTSRIARRSAVANSLLQRLYARYQASWTPGSTSSAIATRGVRP